MLSMIGHSLGGLYCRSAAARLDAVGFLEQVTPVALVTLASPHLGIRDADEMTVWGAAMTKGQSGRDVGMPTTMESARASVRTCAVLCCAVLCCPVLCCSVLCVRVRCDQIPSEAVGRCIMDTMIYTRFLVLKVLFARACVRARVSWLVGVL